MEELIHVTMVTTDTSFLWRVGQRSSKFIWSVFETSVSINTNKTHNVQIQPNWRLAVFRLTQWTRSNSSIIRQLKHYQLSLAVRWVTVETIKKKENATIYKPSDLFTESRTKTRFFLFDCSDLMPASPSQHTRSGVWCRLNTAQVDNRSHWHRADAKHRYENTRQTILEFFTAT